MHKLNLILFLFYTLLLGCGVTPDPNNPGKCDLDCSAANLIGSSSGMAIELYTSDYAILCGQVNAPFSLGVPFTVRFRFYNQNGGSVFNPGDPGQDFNADIQIPHVSFHPIIRGARDPQKTSSEVAEVSTVNGVTTVDPWEYHGIVTPKGEWCSDKCGVATIEYVPMCSTQTHEITTAIGSGGLSSELGGGGFHTLTMQTEEP